MWLDRYYLRLEPPKIVANKGKSEIRPEKFPISKKKSATGDVDIT